MKDPWRRPFRFGLHAESAGSAAEWTAKARRAEALGFGSLLMPDHFAGQLAPLSALTAAACATSRLRVGGLVFCNDFRHPAVLAKEIATLDLMSGGRVEVGVGAGWNAAEYEAAGFEFTAARRRVERVEETAAILCGIWTGATMTYRGRHYTLVDHPCDPRPVQRPHPPLLLPGGGPRMLALAADRAAIVDVTSGFADAATVGRRVAILKTLVRGVRQPPELCALLLAARACGPHSADEIARELGWAREQVAQSPNVLAGDTEAMVDQLLERRERLGISYVIASEATVDVLAPVVARLAGT